MEKELKECANPDCKAKFYPHHSGHRVCRKIACKAWLYQQSHGIAKYKFTEEFIDKVIDANNKAPGEPLNVGPSGIRLDIFIGITFTRDDIERIN